MPQYLAQINSNIQLKLCALAALHFLTTFVGQPMCVGWWVPRCPLSSGPCFPRQCQRLTLERYTLQHLFKHSESDAMICWRNQYFNAYLIQGLHTYGLPWGCHHPCGHSSCLHHLQVQPRHLPRSCVPFRGRLYDGGCCHFPCHR